MARSAGTKLEQNFVNGIVTEATGLNFPESACTDASNVVFDVTGKVHRRLGLDFESGWAWNTFTRNNYANVEYVWNAVAGDGETNYLVQQIGATLYFFRIVDDVAISSGRLAGTVLLTDFDVSGAPSTVTEPCSFSSGKGYLFVTHPYCSPFYVSVDLGTEALTATAIDIKIRDFEGVTDSAALELDPETRPTSLTDAHKYNICNQGWYPASVLNNFGNNVNPITFWFSTNGFYPNNCEQWWAYRHYTINQFDPRLWNKYGPGNSPAPRGHYLLDPFNTDRSGFSGIGTVTETSSSYYRPSCTAFFAGRVWYAGVNYSGYGNQVYYTQIIENNKQFGACHQLNDPTSETLSDLLDTDGGVVKILDMGTVHYLFASQKALLIFASNGIWSIAGSDVTSFKATDYTVKRVSSIGVDTSMSFVDVLGAPVFWNNDGIWTLKYEGGDFTATSVSDQRIATLYNAIPHDSKKWAKGAYNASEKIIQWVYSSTAPTTVDERFQYDKALLVSLKTGAFYTWDLSDDPGKYVLGIVAIVGTDSNTFRYIRGAQISGTSWHETIAHESNTTYLDWVAEGRSINYESYFLSGYKVDAEGNKSFQVNYLTFFLENETDSSAFVRGCWDYTNDASSGKWSTAQQIYLSKTYRDYQMRRVKIRGWGNALQYKIYSESGKPFTIIGWSGFETANSGP